MQPAEIKVGGCYRTAKNEVRNVIDITDDKRVIYRARNSAYTKGEASWYQSNNVSTLPLLSTFAYAAIGEVPCDWDSATTPPPLPSVPGIAANKAAPAKPAASNDGPPDF